MFAIERRVSVDNRLHIFAPSHTQFLARLLADIYKLSVAHVALAQIDNIHKRHATGVEAEKEKVASQCLLSVLGTQLSTTDMIPASTARFTVRGNPV